MPSPFPGMDPYLDGHLFQDVHHALANEIRDRLAPHVAPKYVARLMTYRASVGGRGQRVGHRVAAIQAHLRATCYGNRMRLWNSRW